MFFFSLLLYNTFIRLYTFAIGCAGLFLPKAKKWTAGRRQFPAFNLPAGKRVWFHCASLGEMEQARPLIEQIKAQHPKTVIVLSFFSPSGYEVRKDYALADAVVYLPADTAANAAKFIARLQPDLVIFVKYEFWFHYLREVHRRRIPLILLAGTFRPNQIFFRRTGLFFRHILSFFSTLFVQDRASQLLLQSIAVPSKIACDTRFDRVSQIAQQAQRYPLIEQFRGQKQLLVAGSTWEKDEALLAAYLKNKMPATFKLILAPHEISKQGIARLRQKLPGTCLCYSELNESNAASATVLVIDNYGMLASLYAYGTIAYVGGGFGASVHNVLEAAVYGQAVIFGPKHQKSVEAKELAERQAGFVVSNEQELWAIMEQLTTPHSALLEKASTEAKNYVAERIGGTAQVIAYLEQQNYL